MDEKQRSRFEQIEQIAREATDKEIAFLQHILLVSSSTLGILVSLHPQTLGSQSIRFLFVAVVVIIGLAILSNTIALYSQIKLVRRAQSAIANEYAAAFQENRKAKPVCVYRTKWHKYSEPATYVLLLVALVLLCAYAICVAWC